MYGVVYSLQCTMCSVQCAVCSVQYAVCSVQCAVFSVQCSVCSEQCAVPGYSLLTISIINFASARDPGLLAPLSAVCSVQSRVCSVSCAVRSVQCAVCSVQYPAAILQSDSVATHLRQLSGVFHRSARSLWTLPIECRLSSLWPYLSWGKYSRSALSEIVEVV